MPATRSLRQYVGFREIGVVTTAIVSIVVVPLVTIFWLIAFDSSGLDQTVPDSLYMTVLPSLTVALLPGIVGFYFYDLKRSLLIGSVTFLVAVVFMVYLNMLPDAYSAK